MLASIGLYSYGFISTRWNSINNDLIFKHSQKLSQEYLNEFNSNQTIQFEYQSIGLNIRTRYGLFGYCSDYKLFQLLTIKSTHDNPSNCSSCMKPDLCCKETNRCVKPCNNKLECPSHIDENSCVRNYHQTDYYWNEGKCMWHSYIFDIQGIPRWFLSYFQKSQSTKQSAVNLKLVRYYIMLILFLTAPLLTLFGLLILYSISCIDRFYSIPFGFLSCFSFGSFMCGSTALGIFIYNWIDQRLYEFYDKIEINHVPQSIAALNPWINQIETFGLAFWIILGAIGLNLFTTLLSCCFCCGLQSEKSKLRIHVNNDKYAIVHTNLYDE